MDTLQVRLRVDFANGGSIGPGKIDLLESISRTGSLSGAARALKMSYRRAWLLLHSVNEAFEQPAVELSVGGRQGGGAELTPFGTQLIYAYRNLHNEVSAVALERFGRLTLRKRAVAAPTRRSIRGRESAPRAGRRRSAPGG